MKTFIKTIILTLSFSSMAQENHTYTNALIEETSPYLLQHAHNPVNWYAWNDETLEMAKRENKLLLISIGYSSCHWCHVMEHESFENEAVAKVMNDNYICIKVDREERPDVDQFYMTAVQLITGRGGWPLNCIALPDGRPVWGGTYFPRDNWVKSLEDVSNLFKSNPNKVEEYANNLVNGIKQRDALVPIEEEFSFSRENVDEIFVNWSRRFDSIEGGPNKAPKFPLPNNYEYLLNYGLLGKNQKALDHVELTLDKMCQGGIYDQIGGGFARYSTDELWKVPHFEKMLYDNAQLMGLYSKAYRVFKNEDYRKVVCQTFDFIQREMTGPNGEFYSALDADSEGEEGKFYVWNEEELQKVIRKKEWDLFASYYNVNKAGLWEGSYILLRKGDDASFAKENEMSLEELGELVDNWNESLLELREKRVRPGLDDKSLTSWNALMIDGLVEAYMSIGESQFIDAALKNASFIESNQLKDDGSLYHSYKAGKSSINGFLEDYALTAFAFIKLFEATGQEKWLLIAKELTEYAKLNFEDEKTGLFFFTSNDADDLISKPREMEDNVIPSSNSVMARNLYYLSLYTGKMKWIDQARQMTAYVLEDITRYGEGYSNWGEIILHEAYSFYEVAIVGSESQNLFREMHNREYMPNVIWGFSKGESRVDIFEDRLMEGATYIYVCQKQACKMPVEEIEYALEQMTFE